MCHNNNNVVGCFVTCFVGNNITPHTTSMLFFHSNKPILILSLFSLQRYSMRECFLVNFDRKSSLFLFFSLSLSLLILIQIRYFHINLGFLWWFCCVSAMLHCSSCAMLFDFLSCCEIRLVLIETSVSINDFSVNVVDPETWLFRSL